MKKTKLTVTLFTLLLAYLIYGAASRGNWLAVNGWSVALLWSFANYGDCWFWEREYWK